LVVAWNDLQPEQQDALRTLRQNRQLLVQYQGPDTGWKSKDGFFSFEDLALFPAAGNIGLVRRLRRRRPGDDPSDGNDDDDDDDENSSSNCRLLIHSDRNIDATGVGVTIELIATRDVPQGQVLVVDLPETDATPKEYSMLAEEMKLTGQPYYRKYFADAGGAATTEKHKENGGSDEL
jgi:hypothetical protein